MAACIAAALVLGACGGQSGFQPLYGSLGGQSVQAELAGYEIATIPGRVGQRIRNELVFQQSGGAPDAPIAPTHRVDIVIKETISTTLVTITGDSAGQVYQLQADYRIVDLKSQKVVFQSQSTSRAGFERHQQIYSNIRGRENAEDRAAAHVATDIRNRLAAFAKARQNGVVAQ
jgi:LPS-assembly lipoprotein